MKKHTLLAWSVLIALFLPGSTAKLDASEQESVAHLLAELKRADEAVRWRALTVLGSLGAQANEALPVITKQLEDPSGRIRAKAAETIWRITGKTDNAVHVLAECLSSEDPEAIQYAADALVRIGTDAVPVLLQGLKAPNVRAREACCRALAVTEADVTSTVPSLEELLDDEPRICVQASLAIWRVAGQAERPAKALASVLRGSDGTVKAQAAYALAEIGPGAWQAGQALIALMDDPDPAVRAAGAFALGRIQCDADRVVPRLGQLLADDNDEVRFEVTAALGRYGEDAIAVLVKLAKGDHYLTRLNAVRALAEVGSDDPSVVAAIESCLQDTSLRVQIEAAWALSRLGENARVGLMKSLRLGATDASRRASDALAEMGTEAVPGLAKLLSDKNAVTRRLATFALGEIGPEASSAVPQLVALYQAEQDINPAVCRALADIGAPSVPALIQALKDDEPFIRRQAVVVLGVIGGEADAAVPALIECAGDADVEVAIAAVASLGKMGESSKPAIPRLIEFLGVPWMRDEAATALASLGRHAVPALVRAVDDSDHRARVGACKAIARIGPEARSAVPTLVKRLDESSFIMQRAACEALGSVGPDAGASVPRVAELLTGEDLRLRSNAAKTLAGIGKEAVPALCDAIAQNEDTVQRRAIEALGEIGRDATTALPVLSKLLDNEDPALRFASARAIWQIEQKPERVVEVLAKLLNEDGLDPVLALSFLEQIGPKSAPALPAIEKILEDEALRNRDDMPVLLAATVAHWEIARAPDRVLPVLTYFIGKPLLVDVDVLNALARLGPKAEPLAPQLIEFLRHHEERARPAADILASIGTPSIPLLVERLRIEGKYDIGWSEDEKYRAQAIHALGKIGKDASSAIPAIINHLGIQHSNVRKATDQALASIGTAAVEPLTRALKAADVSTRRRAALILGEIGGDARAALPALHIALSDEADTVRVSVAKAISRIDPGDDRGFKVLLDGLGYEDHRARELAAATVGGIPEKSMETIPRLVAMLADPNVSVRRSAAQTLGKLGPKSAAAVPALVAELKPRAPVNKKWVCLTLRQIGPAAAEEALPVLMADLYASERDAMTAISDLGPSVVPALVEALDDESATVRVYAARTLGWLGADAAPTVPELAEALSDVHGPVRQAAAFALGEIGEDATAAAPALIEVLRDPEPAVVKRAISALGSIGSQAKDAVPALVGILEDDPEREVELAVLVALTRFGQPALLGLKPVLEADTDTTALAARSVLAMPMIHPGIRENETYQSLLRRVIRGDDSDARVQAVELLPLKTDEDVAFLISLMDDESRRTAWAAGKALSHAPPEYDARVCTAVVSHLHGISVEDNPWDHFSYGEDRSERSSYLWDAAAILRDKRDHAIPALVNGLSSKVEDVRAASAVILGLFGAAATEAREPLEVLLQDESGLVRARTATALSRIGSDLSLADAPAGVISRALCAKLRAGDDAHEVLRSVIEGIGCVGVVDDTDIPSLARMLRHEDHLIRRAALQAAIGVDVVADVPATDLIACAREQMNYGFSIPDHPTPKDKPGFYALTLMDKSATQDLIDILGSDDVKTRRLAAFALGKIGSGAAKAVPALTEALRESETADAALEALGRIGKAGAAALPTYIELLARGDVPSGPTSVALMGDKALSHVTAALTHDKYSVRHWALSSLADFGPSASAATPKVIDILKGDPRIEMRTLAAEILGQPAFASHKETIPALRKALDDKAMDEEDDENMLVLGGHLLFKLPVRHNAAISLYRLGEEAPTAAAFAQLLRGQSSDKRAWARKTLVSIGAPAAPMLASLLRDDTVVRTPDGMGYVEHEVGDVAEAILVEIGPPAFDAIVETLDRIPPASDWPELRLLRQWLRDPGVAGRVLPWLSGDDPQKRAVAAMALGELGIDTQVAFRKLLAATQDDYAWVRLNAAQALWDLRADATAPFVMMELLPEEDPQIRWATTHQIGRMAASSEPNLDGVFDVSSPAGLIGSALASFPHRQHDAGAVLAEDGLLALAPLLSDDGPRIKFKAIQAIAAICRTWNVEFDSPSYAVVFPLLVRACADEDHFVANIAESALRDMSRDQQYSLRLQELTESSDEQTRRGAEQLLQN